jgi:uncharacterized caspase-like protein
MFVLLSLPGPAQAEKRVALVIGNSAYQNAPPLKNPRSDAEDFAATVKRLGFEVIAGYDLDERGMAQKVRDFARALEGADVGLFFYAGHGLQAKGLNYLVPVNAALKTESDLDFETLPLDLVLKQMQRSARVSLVFLDACRDNPLTRSLRASSRSTSVGQGLARIEEAAGMMIAFSTQPGNVALDGSGRNSPFTKALLAHIDKPGVTIGDVMIDVRKQVISETGEKQIPWENSSLTGKFYFNPGPQVASAELGTPKAAPSAAGESAIGVSDAALDHTFWTSIANSNDPALYREYLRRFPTGTYVAIAEAKLQALSQSRTAAVTEGQGEKTAAVTTGTAEAGRSLQSPRQIAEEMQRELKRVGCYSGAVTGSWNRASRAALERFNQETKLDLKTDPPNSEGISKVKSFPGIVCEQPAQTQQARRRDTVRERSESRESEGPVISPTIRLNIPGFRKPF